MLRDRWRVMVTALAVALALAVAGCGDDEEEPAGGGSTTTEESAPAEAEEFPADTTMGKIQAKGEIAIGVKYDVPPFGFKNPQSGDVEGFDVDFGKAVADKLGRRAEARRGDLRQPHPVHPGRHGRPRPLDDDDQRRARRRRSGSRTRTSSRRDGSSCRRAPTSRASTTSPASKVCTALGSTYEETLKTQAPKADLRLVDAYSECLELLQNGAVDAISTDDVILTGMIIQDDSLKLVGDELTVEPYGGGFKKDDTEFAEFLNGVLEEYK